MTDPNELDSWRPCIENNGHGVIKYYSSCELKATDDYFGGSASCQGADMADESFSVYYVCEC